MAVDMSVLTRQVGPLPVWGYGAIAGGVLLILSARHGNIAASNLLNPNVAPSVPGSAPLPGDVTGGAIPSPVTGGPGDTTNPVVDGVTGITARDLFGNGTLPDLIKSIGPDYTQFDFHSGNTGVDVSHSAQNVLDVQRRKNELDSAFANQKAAYDYSLGAVGENNAYALANAGLYYDNSQKVQQAQYDYLLGLTGLADTTAIQKLQAIGQYKIGSYLDTGNGAYATYAASPAITPTTPAPVASSPTPIPTSCGNGNFACIRANCNRGNNSCARAIATWWNPSMGF